MNYDQLLLSVVYLFANKIESSITMQQEYPKVKNMSWITRNK